MSDVDDMQSWIDDAGESLGRRVDDSRPRRDFAEVMGRASKLSELEIAEGELTGFVADARDGLDRRIDGAPQSASFGDAMARAHALDRVAVDHGKLAEAQRLAPVVDLRRHSMGERALGAFVDDARAGVEATIDRRRTVAPGSASAGKPAKTSVLGRVAIVLAVAAAGIFAVASVFGPELAERDGGPGAADAEQAQLIEEHESARGEARRVAPRAVKPNAAEDLAVEPEPAVEPELAVEPEIEPARPRSSQPRSSRPRAEPPSLADLAALAKEQWRAGDLAGAEQTLGRIVDRGGTSRWADNAFSDLFALAHRRGDARAQQRWWRAYLRRFPRGRFADDALAGSCRASSKGACWATYLERFPDGSYRGEARRMVDGG